MMQFIRDRASGWIAYIIVALLVLSFGVWGIESYLGGSTPNAAAVVNGDEIPLRDFQQAFRQRQQAMEQQRAQLDPAAFDEERLKGDVLESLVRQQLILQATRNLGLRVGDDALAANIAQNPRFQTNGQFDRGRFEAMVNQMGYSPEGFAIQLRTQLMTEQLIGAIVDTVRLPAREADALIAQLRESREVSYLLLEPSAYQSQVEVTDEALEAYFNSHQADFQRPEQVKIAYVDLTADALGAGEDASESELRAMYNERLREFGEPERREVSQILVTVDDPDDADAVGEAQEKAQALRERIDAEGFDAVFEAFKGGEDPQVQVDDLGEIGRGLIEPAFDTALFGLASVGDVSDPVQTGYGFHVLRLDGIVEGDVKPFEEVREQLAAQQRQQAGEARFYDAAERLYNLSFEQPDSLQPAADALGLEVQTSDWISRSGGDEALTRLQPILEAAFSEAVLERGENSAPVEISNNRAVVLRVVEHREAQPLSLDEAREQVEQAYRREQAGEAMAADAEAIVSAIESGESVEAVAERYPARLDQPGAVTRESFNLAAPILQTVFELPAPQEGEVSVGTTQLAALGQAVVVVSSVTAGDPSEITDEERQNLIEPVEQVLGRRQLEAMVNSLRAVADVQTFPDRL